VGWFTKQCIQWIVGRKKSIIWTLSLYLLTGTYNPELYLLTVSKKFILHIGKTFGSEKKKDWHFKFHRYTYTETDVPLAIPKNESSKIPMPWQLRLHILKHLKCQLTLQEQWMKSSSFQKLLHHQMLEHPTERDRGHLSKKLLQQDLNDQHGNASASSVKNSCKHHRWWESMRRSTR